MPVSAQFHDFTKESHCLRNVPSVQISWIHRCNNFGIGRGMRPCIFHNTRIHPPHRISSPHRVFYGIHSLLFNGKPANGKYSKLRSSFNNLGKMDRKLLGTTTFCRLAKTAMSQSESCSSKFSRSNHRSAWVKAASLDTNSGDLIRPHRCLKGK